MKKLFVTLMMFTFVFGAIAQNNVKIPVGKDVLPGEKADHIKVPYKYDQMFGGTREMVHSNYTFTSALDDWTANGNTYASILFPDTNVYVRYSDGGGGHELGYVSWCSVGAMFDPRSDMFANYMAPDYKLEDQEPYTLDTVAFFFTYERFTTDAVIDTLVVHIYNTDKVHAYNWVDGGGNPIEPFGTVGYDIAKGEGTDFTLEFKYELTIQDTNTFADGYWGIFTVPIPGGMSATGPVAVTWTFKPGYEYTTNDTMGGQWDNPEPYKKLNAFKFGLYSDNDAWLLETYNNGLLVVRWGRYEPWPDANHQYYFAGTGWNDYSYYAITYFGITFDDEWAVEELNNNVSVSDIYPNPTNGVANVKVSLQKPEKVKIEVINALGQKVSETPELLFPVGSHVVDINTNELEQGLYYCRISSASSFVTKSFIVK